MFTYRDGSPIVICDGCFMPIEADHARQASINDGYAQHFHALPRMARITPTAPGVISRYCTERYKTSPRAEDELAAQEQTTEGAL